jgi:hypothetical protein
MVILSAAQPATAQVPEAPTPVEREGAPTLVRWGKWGATALFVGLTAAGIGRHNGANADFEALLDWCRGAGSCELGPGGAYADPVSERFYQSAIAGDRAARRWLIAGQVALAGAVALFIVDLTHAKGPENIPFDPQFEVVPHPSGTRIGLRFALPALGP